MNWIDLFMFGSGACFALGSTTAAWKSFQLKRNVGVPAGTFWPIIIGIVCNYAYLFLLYGFNLTITVSYLVEGSPWLVVVYFHYFGRNK